VARALAEFLFGSEKSLIRFDMSEFMEQHSVSKLIGSPPGYVGYEEGGQLTERVRRAPYSIILLDEIEKAHPDIYNLLLQVFEDGQLTDGLGNTVDFKNTIIIMTSNLGARFLEKRSPMGFSAPGNALPAKVEDQVMAEVKKAFNPEFLNRLDETILFTSLNDEDLLQIMELLTEHINKNLAAKQIKIRLNPDAAKYILEKTCGDRSYGARPSSRCTWAMAASTAASCRSNWWARRPTRLRRWARYRRRSENRPVGQRGGGVTLKVSEKGAVSVYGLGLAGSPCLLQGAVGEAALDGRPDRGEALEEEEQLPVGEAGPAAHRTHDPAAAKMGPGRLHRGRSHPHFVNDLDWRMVTIGFGI